MSRRRTFFERITGTVNTNDRSNYRSVHINHDDDEADYYDEEYDQSDQPDQYPRRGQINNSVATPHEFQHQGLTENKANFNNEWLSKDQHGGELSIDLYELDDEIIIQAMIAGVRPEDLDVNLTREMVTIEGHREGPQGIPDNNYYNQELFWGAFTRSITLPDEIEVEEAEAAENHGLLTIRMPKLDKARSTKLKVRSRG
jgi:HSP20 family protein